MPTDLVWSQGNAWVIWMWTIYCLGKQDRGPREVQLLIPRTCQCVTLQGKRDFADVIKLRILLLPWIIWADSVSSQESLQAKQGDRRVRVRKSWRCCSAGFETRVRGHQPRNGSSFCKPEKAKEMDEQGSRRNQRYWHLDFSLGKLILQFWPPEV